jgi:hypothetical protein
MKVRAVRERNRLRIHFGILVVARLVWELSKSILAMG